MKTKALLLASILSISVVSHASAQWRLEGWFGDAYSIPSPVKISQNGEPDLHISANWSTRPWRPTWYYSARIAKWNDSSAWAFEYMHHKLYLDNPTEEVKVFRVTNGVNNFLVERLWRRHGWEYGVGAGPMLAVPISNIRDKVYGLANGVFNSNYELDGATLQGSLARRVKLIPFTYGTLAIKGTITGMRLGVAEGHASMMNYALHLQYGVSFQSKQ